jgi:GNAT superfamily N-acetyltransferase
MAGRRKPDTDILPLLKDLLFKLTLSTTSQRTEIVEMTFMDPHSNEPELSVTLSDGFAESDRGEIAPMYWAAFGSKLRIALRPSGRAIGMLSEALNPDFAVVARAADGQLLGVAGYKTPRGSFMAINFVRLKRHFGTFGAIWRGLVLSLLERQPDAGTLLMDGIFVTERARGQGVGTLLLNAIKRKAEEQGCAHVRLDVIDTNPRAQQLYEREGFRAVASRDLGALRHLFGFRRATTMIAASGKD